MHACMQHVYPCTSTSLYASTWRLIQLHGSKGVGTRLIMNQQKRSPGFVTIRPLSQPSGSVGPSFSLPTTVLQQVR